MTFRILFSFFLIVVVLFPACKEDEGGNSCSNNFDQEAMYRNLADNLIIPSYESLLAQMEALEVLTNDFLDFPSKQKLTLLREGYRLAYVRWQQAAPFEFGPAETVFLRSSVNNFPADIDRIEQNIQTGNYDLNAFDTYDKGFPALDYLLYGIAPSADGIVLKYSTDPQANSYKQYLTDVLDDLKERIAQTHAGWTTGDYRSTFISNTGTAAGTSLSLIINNLGQHYEMIKREKIGVPLGVVTLGIPNPDKVEALYGGFSVKLAEEAAKASRRFFLGEGVDGSNRAGLDDFLAEVGAEKDGQPLEQVILDQYGAALSALQAVPDPLETAIENDTEQVENAYAELTRQVVHIKTDMPSILCVAITYVDNPSDSD